MVCRKNTNDKSCYLANVTCVLSTERKKSPSERPTQVVERDRIYIQICGLYSTALLSNSFN